MAESTERIITPEALRPLHWAESLTRCSLLWMPAPAFPLPRQDRTWMLAFLTRLQKLMAKKGPPQLFISQQVVYEKIRDLFLDNMIEACPMMGLLRRPGSALKAVMNEQDAEDLSTGRRKYDPFNYMDSYTYWLLGGTPEQWLPLYWGFGGMTLLYLKADPVAAAPVPAVPKYLASQPGMKRLLETFPLQAQANTAAALQNPYAPESKKVFGADLKDSAYVKGLPFIVPALSSADFFARPAQDIDALFNLVDIYIQESPADGGVLLATRLKILPEISDVLEALRQEGLLPNAQR